MSDKKEGQISEKTLPELPQKSKRDYFIADISASSDDEPEQNNVPFKQTSYLESLQKESNSSSYNRELQEHIRQTRLREERRKELLSTGVSPSIDDKILNSEIHPDFPASRVNIRYKPDGRIIDEAEDLKTESLLPSVKDPKLWKVNCQIGKERQAVCELINLYQNSKEAGQALFVQSAFTSDLCKGYIYVEALKKAHVLEAVSQAKKLYRNRISLVPITEMPETLQPGKQLSRISTGTWVRVNRGPFKGDLAQVIEVIDDGFKLEIQLVPRLDFVHLKNKIQFKRENELKKNGENPNKGKLNRPKISRIPPSRPFNEQELRNFLETFCEPTEIDAMFYYSRGDIHFNGLKFQNGYQLIKMSASSLDLDVSPSESEIRKYRSVSLSTDEIIQNVPANDEKKEVERISFRFDDCVRVVNGDLAKLTGRVVSIKGDKVFILPNHPELNEALGFTSSELEKYFQIGSHVKILNGTHKNETGCVTALDEEKMELTIFTDMSKKTITAGVNDAIETSEVSSGRNQLNGYSLMDFVQIDRDLCGIIVKVMQNSLKVLDNNGVVQNLELKNILGKPKSRNAYSLDKKGNQITLKDDVKIVDKSSHFYNTMGTVFNIYKNKVFLRSRETSENCSMFVMHSNNLLVTGTERSTGLNKTIRFNRNRWEGRNVNIIKGSHKGKQGRVKSAPHPEKLLVELLAEDKVVTVNRSDIQEVDDNPLNSGLNSDYKTPLIGAQTPAMNYMQTPSNGEMPSETPLYGGQTYRSGSQTPMYGGKTPMYGGQTPMYGGKTPMYGGQTPKHGMGRKSSYKLPQTIGNSEMKDQYGAPRENEFEEEPEEPFARSYENTGYNQPPRNNSRNRASSRGSVRGSRRPRGPSRGNFRANRNPMGGRGRGRGRGNMNMRGRGQNRTYQNQWGEKRGRYG